MFFKPIGVCSQESESRQTAKARARTWRVNQSEEQKQRTRELACIRQQRYVERHKEKVS